MKKLILPILAASAAATPALAAPVITFNSVDTSVPGFTTAQIFESFENYTTGGTAFPTPQVKFTTNTTATETGTTNAKVYTSSVPGLAADPDNNGTNKYLAIQSGASFNVAFSTPVQFFSFILGSLDAYNQVVLSLTDGSTITLTGQQIISPLGALAPVGPYNSSTAGRVNYDFGGGAGLTNVLFRSFGDSFEIDGLATAVPEAATWAMMMVGLGMVGGAMRRRKAKVSVSYAAA